MIPQFRALAAFLRTRRLARQLRTRADIETWQTRRLATWRAVLRRTILAFRDGGPPVMDKAVLMADFARFNAIGLDADEGWAMFESRRPQRRGYAVGASTGTSGNRGLYVVSDAERYEWLGVLLAKALPRFPLETAKIALVLPLNSALYRAAKLPGLNLRFFDLHDGLDAILPAVAAHRPDTVIAPPKILRALAEMDRPPALKRVFSGAEVLDPLDREVIEARFGVRVREIYMATEGLLGVACEHGTLHLCEDAVRFDWEDVPDSDLKAPLISDFTRRTQAMARYRMNDLLRLSFGSCPCGSPLQAVTAIEGRCDDMLVLPSTIGGTHTVTPDVLRNAVVDSDRRIRDFRVVQVAPDRLEVTVFPPEAGETARLGITAVLDRLGVRAEVRVGERPMTTSARKLRRVERMWKG